MKEDRVMAWVVRDGSSRAASVAESADFPFPADVEPDPDAERVVARLSGEPYEVILIEDSPPFPRTKRFLEMTEDRQSRPVVVVLARSVTVPAAVALMESGVFTIVPGEYTAEQAASAVSRAFANRRAFEKIMELSDSLRESEGTIETLSARVAAERDRLAKANEELNFLLHLATSLHEDPDLDAVFAWLCGNLQRFVPYRSFELLSLVGTPALRSCGAAEDGGRKIPGGSAGDLARIRTLLDRNGLCAEVRDPIRKEFPPPPGISPPSDGSGANRPFRWETTLSFGTQPMGVLSVHLPKAPTEEWKRLLRSLSAQMSLFLHNTAEREKVREMATQDALTGLCNFRSFREVLGREFERFLRYGRNLALMMIDLDDFKNVNDRFGHQAGDKVLHHLGDVIRRNLRKTDYGFRYGGDEFVVLLPDRSAGQAEIFARKILHAMRKLGESPHFRFPLSVSIGIADCSVPPSRDPVDLLKRADIALYRAKELGRDRIVASEPPEERSAGEGRCDALV
ncbi:MAG: hypothetical protein OHK0028_08990 [Deltaproteobacteria bacterium]